MQLCKHFSDQLSFYLDDELNGDERRAFEAHLRECHACRGRWICERRFLERVRGARPIFQTPTDLQERIESALNTVPAQPPSKLSPSAKRRRNYHWMVVVAAAAVAIMLGTFYLTRQREILQIGRPSEIALLAVDTHLRHLRGQLPLEIIATSSEQISQWFAGKIPFDLTLPNYQESSGQEKIYQPVGARLVGFKNDYAPCVVYRMDQQPITLIIVSDSVALPSGGKRVKSKGIIFHYDSIDEQKVITWTDDGLTYALVSNLAEQGQQSCLVCHAGTKDRDFIHELKSLP